MTVVALEQTELRGRFKYRLYRCFCGQEFWSYQGNVESGKQKSCGCLRSKRTAEKNFKHGMSHSRTHNIWLGLKQRCLNPKNARYADYGGRGITICQRWLVFENFLADMGECPEGLSLDRYPNPDGPYCKENCRWATPLQQRHNRRAA